MYGDEDVMDIGYCVRCGCDMSGEPPAAFFCSACTDGDDEG